MNNSEYPQFTIRRVVNSYAVAGEPDIYFATGDRGDGSTGYPQEV